MSKTKSAFGRRARSVCIVTELPVRLQEQISPTDRQGVEPVIVRIGSGVLRITQLGSGELVIEIEPP